MNKVKSILPFIFFLFSLYGCAQNNPSETLNVKQLRERINNNDTTMVILDVRTDAELTGPYPKIKDALHIPVQELKKRVNELDKNKEIVIICRTQNRSANAADFLRAQGHNVKYVIGGMQEFYRR